MELSEGEINRAIRQQPAEHRIFCGHAGWRNDDTAFVLQDQCIPPRVEGTTLLPPRWQEHLQRPALQRQGKTEAWTEKVAKPAGGSSRLLTGIAAAFAAPLIKTSGLQPFGLLFYGPSKVGKSLLLTAAGSTFGIGEERDLPAWNVTDAGFDELARLHNDLPLLINELAVRRGAKTKIYGDMRSFAYRFSEGKELRRHSGF
ncbi:protein of unknown function [Faunimonas pinastri]|uniref:DUF927 domain-containing protein n=1 Tax=Faunimonas pinastri TaxID=1855383 RepID=A0A1H9HD53_9HYPH|nr:DUF927 domain-containing protein [Faunimonas pinastri]SEQ60178.1 protein of unknown function [Faunimonas pinastri]